MKKRYGVEQIVAKLRQADVELSKGLEVSKVCKQLGVSEQTYYRWRTKYGGWDYCYSDVFVYGTRVTAAQAPNLAAATGTDDGPADP